MRPSLNPDIGSVWGINFPWLHRVTPFDERARTFPALPTSARVYGSRHTTNKMGIGGLLHSGSLNTLCLKRWSFIDRSAVSVVADTFPWKIYNLVAFCRRRFFAPCRGTPSTWKSIPLRNHQTGNRLLTELDPRPGNSKNYDTSESTLRMSS